ncbi:uncharacterized protein [Diadema antillarum]|uniref:uncharacterized protein n=1 Tax=Diadema antillarum TaxID=105358 RepID=UPI003A864497
MAANNLQPVGIFEVPLANIEEGNAMYTLIKASASRVEAYKAAIVANPQIQIPILPVMSTDEDWHPERAESSRYMLLAGCNLLAALLDLIGDEKFAHLRKCTVRVHGAVGIADALQIAALFQQEQSLLIDDVPTLQAKVAVCRRLLYSIHDLDEHADEPPTRVQDSWRKQAAAALGCLSTNPRDRKKLETTFQMALYSRRCYAKMERLFTLYAEKNGKALKQTVFMSLQGLREEERYSLLTQAVNGEVELHQLKTSAKRLKGIQGVRTEFQLLAKKKSWEECCMEYPEYTSDADLEQFIGMDFKKAIPRDFFNYVQEATQPKTGVNAGTSSTLRESPVRLTILEVDSTTNMSKVSRDLKDGSANVIVISDTIAIAYKWQQQLENQGFEICGESVVAGENSARYVTAATSERRYYTMRRVVTEEDMVQSILSTFSDAQDQVALAVKEYDAIQDETIQLGRMPRRLTLFNPTTIPVDSSGSDYEFSELDSAE